MSFIRVRGAGVPAVILMMFHSATYAYVDRGPGLMLPQRLMSAILRALFLSGNLWEKPVGFVKHVSHRPHVDER